MMTVRPFGALDPSLVPKPVDPTGQFDNLGTPDTFTSVDQLLYYTEAAYAECVRWSTWLAQKKPSAAAMYDDAGNAFARLYQQIQAGASSLDTLIPQATAAGQKLTAARDAAGVKTGAVPVVHGFLDRSNPWLWVIGGVLVTGAVAGGVYAYKRSKRKRAA